MATPVSLLVLLVLCTLVKGQTRNSTNLRVTTILEEPFAFRDPQTNKIEGFIVDLLDRITRRIGYTYTLQLVKDGRYGALQPDGKWSGMIGEVKRGEADIAAAAITVTSMRKAHVAFSHPFLSKTLGILMRRSDIFGTTTEDVFGLSYFLTPFSVGVWLLIIVSFLTVTLGFILLNLFNPYEWRQRVQRGEVKDPDETGDHLGVRESLWFSYSMLALQGYSKRPLSVAARALAVFWMFFIVLTLSSYIALMVRNPNLVVNQSGPKTNVTGLRSIARSGYPITAIQGGSTSRLFKTHASPFFKNISQNMKNTGFVSSTKEGIDRVKKDGTAFVMETAALSYVTNRDCDLVQLADVFADFIADSHYSFVMQKNDTLMEEIDLAILELSETSEINRFKTIWWKLTSPVRCRGQKVGPFPPDMVAEMGEDITKTSGLALEAFGGPLIFLLIGVVISALICLAEILVFKHHDKKPGVPFSSSSDSERA